MSGASLVIGASSGIAQAVISQLLTDDPAATVYRVSRSPNVSQDKNVHSISCDYSEAQIESAIEQLKHSPSITQVFICNGVLHSDAHMPEKRLEDISGSHFLQAINSNTLIPLLWLKHLLPLLNQDDPCTVTLFSARVGSIGDNRLGGWYSYRASKAALNMAVKTAAVEYARRAKQVKLILFHPGTTDTPLSKPFQTNVPGGKLFSPQFVAQQLLSIVDHLEPDGQLSYLDWQGKTIPW
ncbi:SDR family NAD(P)-dependent oxidoreductase [Porticoccus sp. W117]|uniref:SDR family NAD(P)-dependent oxidoreductase n=1 Tax=Porticoccus sp. W117 TaxID=3054777 RepID=UPI002594E681|nr:SDR family NAD(P)-dependent oxidoreductase [Porticoccus sp. W117]MDM3869960.1 SDR family NAD(P)-dependent oxidoreductase [Porticoccus sp. W117]